MAEMKILEKRREEKRREEKRREEKRREEKRREEHIDILRILACLAVIFNHTNERGFYRYVSDLPGTKVWALHLIYSIACKSAVPIFLMIAGALLLRKNESIKNTYLRIPKILFDLLFFSIFYFAIDSYLSGNIFYLNNSLFLIIQGSYWHLWYLYSYIAFLITLPFFRDFAQSIKISNFKIMYIIAVLLMGIIPIIEYFGTGINECIKPSWIRGNIVIYPLLGYMLENRLNIAEISKKCIWSAWIINLFSFIISIVTEYNYLIKEPGNASEMFLCLFCIINAPVVYITVKWITFKVQINRKLSNIICGIGKCTYGIYLLHILFLWKIQPFYKFWCDKVEGKSIGTEFGIYISCICVFSLSGIITYILRKIPIVKKAF